MIYTRKDMIDSVTKYSNEEHERINISYCIGNSIIENYWIGETFVTVS